MDANADSPPLKKKVSRIMAQNLLKAVVLRILGVQVGLNRGFRGLGCTGTLKNLPF